jgi:SAM-dependent methyltransferase
VVTAPFSHTAEVYDLLYEAAGKDYGAEAEELHRLVQSLRPGAATLLDVACGTGAHLAHLRRWYDVAGADIEPSMLAVARERCPGVELVRCDMRALALGRRFDAVTCLFSSVAYGDALDAALAALAAHLTPGGVLVLDGWIRPADWREPFPPHVLTARSEDGSLVACRLGHSSSDGRRSHLELQYLIGRTGQDIVHVVEHHDLTLYTDDEYRRAFAAAGLTVEVVPSPYPDRDRYAGVAPS